MICKKILMLVIGLLLLVTLIGAIEPDLDLSRNQTAILVIAFWTLWHTGVTVLAWCAWVSWGKKGMGAD